MIRVREPARHSGNRLCALGCVFQALRQVRYDGCVTIESFDPDIESVAKLCCMWRKLADSPEQLATEGLKFLTGVYRQVYGQ
jgi:D-psicose/D-tagatose/L-ribulose 3-epimerase